MSCVIRGGARICGAPIPFNPPYRHSPLWHCASGTLDPPQGVEGTSTHLHGHERAGDGASPVARQWRRSARSRRKKRAGPDRGPVRSRTGSGGPIRVTHEVGRREARAGQGGWYRGERRTPALVPSSGPRRRRTAVTETPSYRPVPPQVDLPALEREVLEFWHAQQIFEKSVARNEGADSPGRGPSTRARRPRTAAPAPTTSSRGPSRTSSPGSGPCRATRSTARAAGTATASRSSWRSRRSSASPARPTSRPSASPSSTPGAASRCSATSTCGSR